MFAVFHSDLNIADHSLQYLQLCPFPVTGIYDIPWRRGSIGISHILIKNFSAFFIMIILPEIIFIHSPARILALQEIFHSFLLFFTVDLHKKFQENISVICQLTLKSANTVDPLHITVTFQFLVHTVAAGLVHPSGIQKCEFAIFRNFLEIPVKKRSPQIFLCWSRHGSNFEKTRINILDDLAYGTSFSGSSPSLKQNDHRDLMLLKSHLQFI